jgi:hypothetical protein
MPCKVVFRCEFCGTTPDPETQRGLEAQLQELLFGEYLDIEPGNWLIWSGNGLYGRARYSCGEHRGELKADLRDAYGTLGWHPWAMGPHPVHHRRGRVAARLRLSPGRSSRWSPTA